MIHEKCKTRNRISEDTRGIHIGFIRISWLFILLSFLKNIFITDGGNYIYDLSVGLISEPNIIEQALNLIPGVFENGLFIDLTKKVIIGSQVGTRIISR